MTPKEKAIELVDKYSIKVTVYFTENSIPTVVNADLLKGSAKQCALIAVDEILEISKKYAGKDYEFYQEVKQEIEKL